jgi:SAM-dependent methyltransferase
MSTSTSTPAIPGFGGTLTYPDDPGYDDQRAVWNLMHDRRPALLARPQSATDVAQAIAHARSRGLTIAVRGGGHSLPGHSAVDGGMVIDLRGLSAVSVDPIRRTVLVGGGAALGAVDAAAQAHGLVVPVGVVSHTGAGGLTLGGGVGRLMRHFGLTIDSLLSAEVVLADGRIVTASEDENPDLFWGLRGGGGNFGVVTEFTYRAHPLGPLTVLATFHPLELAADVLHLGEATIADAATPDALLWTSFLRRGPEIAPWLDRALVGQPGIMSLIEWSGDPAEGRERLREIERVLAPPSGELAEIPYLAMQTVTDELLAPGTLRAYVKAGFAAEITDELISVLIERGAQVGSPLSVIELLSMGGAGRSTASIAPPQRSPIAARGGSSTSPHSGRTPIRPSPNARSPGRGTRSPRSTRTSSEVPTPTSWRTMRRSGSTAPTARRSRGSPSSRRPTTPRTCSDSTRTSSRRTWLGDCAQIHFLYRVTSMGAAVTDLPDRERWEATQRSLWGQRPQDWAMLAEPQNLWLMDAALDGAQVGRRTRLLDIGCGSGLALQRAAARGAHVSGIDISPSLLAVAHERVGEAALAEGGIDELPFADQSFDAALAVNALQFAFDPVGALGELGRVLTPGARLAIAGFSAPERCESTALHLVMEALTPAETHADHAPYALAAPGALEQALTDAGFTVESDRELPGDWHYQSLDEALRGVLCSGGGTRAIRLAGEERVRTALTEGLERFAQDDGSYLMHNHFRLLVAVTNGGPR